jgi:hypothetical protein
MREYLYALLAGDEDATRAAYLYGSLAGGIIVIGGLIWESGKINRATAIVILGVCIESFCTVKLFIVDEGIAKDANAKYIRLFERVLRGPSLPPGCAEALIGKPAGQAEISFDPYSPDAFLVAHRFSDALTSAKWELTPKLPVKLADSDALLPPTIAIGASPYGATLILGVKPSDDTQQSSASAIAAAFRLACGFVSPKLDSDPGTIRIVVGASRP